MEDVRIEEDADKGEEDVEDVEDVETTPHNKRTHTFLLHMELLKSLLCLHV